ncbi:hypothetical protein BJY04DRAFT_228669 [Aspergillus karnatakaensis]|uniref:Zn(II)2Cys6 transcription factor n=1 Tax=Aspergillus karnatakaensis TaxID=1810916 RepID=UPI003CCD42E6
MNTTKPPRRPARSCTECARRKVKCRNGYPCEACVRRGRAQSCVLAESTGSVPVSADRPHSRVNEIDQERLLVQDRVSLMETYAADPLLRASHGPQDSPEDLLVILESLSHGRASAERQSNEPTGLYHLYQPIQQVVLMLLPDRGASDTLVRFALSQLSWLHCGVRTGQFWEEHQLFWVMMERGQGELLKDHSWMALYLGILAAACLYISPDQRPPLPQLLHLQPGALPAMGEADPGVALARIWSEAAMDELDASRPLARPSLRTVQTFAILTLCHGSFGQMERQYLLLGTAIHTARCLNMHLLANEGSCPPHLRQRPEWRTAEDRHLGRRLWWTLVVCDWLGKLSHPSSISITGFNTSLSPSASDAELLFQDTVWSATSGHSPLWHLQVISRLAMVVYSNIKAPRDLDMSKLLRAVEQIQEILHQATRQAPTHLAADAPTWLQSQHFLVLYTIHFLRITVARANLVRCLKDPGQPGLTIAQGVRAALEILRVSENPKPFMVQRSWITSSATLAAGVFLAVHLLALKNTFSEAQIATRRQVIQFAADSVRSLDLNARGLLSRGADLLESLLIQESRCIPSDRMDKETLVMILEQAESGKTPTYAPEQVADLDLYTSSQARSPTAHFVNGESGIGFFPWTGDPFMGTHADTIAQIGDWDDWLEDAGNCLV